jgi:manganese/zinc/iron transport system permease protein
MWSEFFHRLGTWNSQDTWIAVVAALAAMACALPGNFLLLRRQSMLGDALSHTALLGIVLAFFSAQAVRELLRAALARLPEGYAELLRNFVGGTTEDSAAFLALQQVLVFAGAVLVGVATAWLTEWIGRLGRVESSAALGVVFVSLFALALLIIGVFGRQLHLDVQCVLLGELETEAESVVRVGPFGVPVPALVNGAALLVNLTLVVLFFKELRIAAFDPHLATSQGIPARLVHYALMAVTAVTIVAAFRSVGSILVIAMLITPAATARLLTDRLGWMVALSLLVAALSGVLGHVLAIAAPLPVFGRLGFANVTAVSTTGMMGLSVGLLFLAALLLAPRYGLVSRLIHRAVLSLRIAAEDILGVLYRIEEAGFQGDTRSAPGFVQRARGLGPLMTSAALAWLRWSGKVQAQAAGLRLTTEGRQQAENLVRSHRLWESFLAAEFGLPEDHLHEAAERVEHFVGPQIREELQTELGGAAIDPHGKAIPPEAAGR